MVDIRFIETAFEDWYKELWARTSLADFLARPLNRTLFNCFRSGYTRGHAQGILDGEERVSARAKRLAEAEVPRVRTHTQGMERRRPPAPVVTSENPEGTASATHIPIVIEGTIELDRNRPLGDYTGEPDG